MSTFQCSISVKAIGIADTGKRAFFLALIGSQISHEVVFKESVSKWLGEREVNKKEIRSLLCLYLRLYALIFHIHEVINQYEAIHPMREEH